MSVKRKIKQFTNNNKANCQLSSQILNRHDVTEILLKVALNIINQIKQILNKQKHVYTYGNPDSGLGQVDRYGKCGLIKLIFDLKWHYKYKQAIRKSALNPF